MKTLKIIFIMGLSVLSLCTDVTFAQVPQPITTVPTPNAWSFAQYGKMNVSYFTGLPSIQVPLHQVKYKNYQIPMTLSYNASGFRPDIHASWVGTGWTLGIGGAVTRQVNGLPDEFSYTMNNTCKCVSTINPNETETFNLGFIKGAHSKEYTLDNLLNGSKHFVNLNYAPFNNPPTWYTYPCPIPYRGEYWGPSCFVTDKFWKAMYIPASSTPDHSTYTGTKDLQSDEYSFNVMGYSGKFYFKTKDSIEVISDKIFRATLLYPDDVEIPNSLLQPNSSPHAGATCANWITGYSPWKGHNKYPKALKGFMLTSEDGVTFYFGNRDYWDDAIEYSISEVTASGAGTGSQDPMDYWIANTWHLSGISFPDGRDIHLEYERSDYMRHLLTSEFYFGVTQNNPSCATADAFYNVTGHLTSSKITAPVYLKRITSDLLEATLTWSNTNEANALNAIAGSNYKWKKLDEISIKDYEGTKFRWKFTYFPLTNWNQRLFLQQVEKFTYDGASSINEKYNFEYDNTIGLPDYNVNQNDHWGFWNGTTSVSVDGVSNETLDIKRSPEFAHTKAGMLKKITYPTGGSSEFTYELNTYSKKVKESRHLGVDAVGSNKNAGGLRIRKLLTYEPIANKTNSIEYFYVDGYSNSLTESQISQLPSSGVLNQNAYIYHWSNIAANMYTYATCVQNVKLRISSNQPLYPLFDDYHIGYSNVIEKYQDGSYKKMTFTNHDNGHPDDPAIDGINTFVSPYNKVSSRSVERGKLLTEEIYAVSNKLVSSTENQYSVIPKTQSTDPKTYITHFTLIFLDATKQSGVTNPYSYVPVSYVLSNRYKEYTYRYMPTRVIKKLYDQKTNNYLITEQEIQYNNPRHGQPSVIIQKNSDGKQKKNITTYPEDYPSNEFVLSRLRNTLNIPIEQITTIKDGENSEEKIISGNLNEYFLNPNGSSNRSVIKHTYKLSLSEPLPWSQFTQTTPSTLDFSSTNTWVKDPRYKKDMTFFSYDSYHEPMEFHGSDGIMRGVVAGYNNTKILATTTRKDIYPGYFSSTSFEYFDQRDITGSIIRKNDNSDWVISGQFSSSEVLTGRYSLNGIAKCMNNSRPIWVYVFVKGTGPAPTVHSINADGSIGPVSGGASTLIREINGWKLYQIAMTGIGKFALNSNGNWMDEVRTVLLGTTLEGWLMTTYTYENGLLTSSFDPNYKSAYYEYDALGRLLFIRDENKNIIKKYCYNYAGQPENCN